MIKKLNKISFFITILLGLFLTFNSLQDFDTYAQAPIPGTVIIPQTPAPKPTQSSIQLETFPYITLTPTPTRPPTNNPIPEEEQASETKKSDPQPSNPNDIPGGADAACNPSGTGKNGAFQALTPGKQTLFSPWGQARSGGRSHQGVDLGRSSGTPTFALEPGVVIKTNQADSGLGGVSVTLRGDSGRRYYYAHLVMGSNKHVRTGMRVGKCQRIGSVGKTGNARNTPPHLHIQVSSKSGGWVNPESELAPWPNLR